MSDVITEEWPGPPVMVSVVAAGHSVLICAECGVIWFHVEAAAYEMPDVVEEHLEQDHGAGEQR